MSTANAAQNTVEAGGARSGRRGTMAWAQGLACGALFTFAMPTALLLGVLLAPAIVCLLAHPGCDRSLLRTIALSCIAGSLGPLWHLYSSGGQWDELAITLANPSTLLVAWGGGAGAWLASQILPVILQTTWNMQEANKASAITRELDELTEEWSLLDTAEQKK